METNAVISDCQKYRYKLTRLWDENLPYVHFVGLNPSTADAVINDPTITRCINFAKSWGYGGLIMTNLFAYRTPEPRILFAYNGDIIGPENDRYIQQGFAKAEKTVVAWGNHGIYNNRSVQVVRMLPEVYCLKINQSGQPAHPLYLRTDARPKTFHSSL